MSPARTVAEEHPMTQFQPEAPVAAPSASCWAAASAGESPAATAETWRGSERMEPSAWTARTRGPRGWWARRPYLSFGTFSQSARNFLSPASVSGCFASWSMTENGIVATSAPSFADARTCTGWRTEATSTFVSNR